MSKEKVLNLLGLAQKAGQIAAGDEAAMLAVKKHKAKMLIIAVDAAEATKKDLNNLISKHKTPVFYWSSKQDLGQAVGKSPRAVLAINDSNFANGLAKAVQLDIERLRIEQLKIEQLDLEQ